MQADILFKNAEIFDPDTLDIKRGELAVTGTDISAKGEKLSCEAKKEIDLKGNILSPGFIDHHCHVFPVSSVLGISPDLFFSLGCTAVVDAGSSGFANFKAFANAAAYNMMDVYAYLNAASYGQVILDCPEDFRSVKIHADAIKEVVKQYPNRIRGIKMRFDKSCALDEDNKSLQFCANLAHSLNLPLCVHVTNHGSTFVKILDPLEKGDVVCHVYQNLGETILDDSGKVRKELIDARNRGVIFDAADEYVNFSFDVLKPAVEQGFYPDIIASDLTTLSAFNNHVYGLPLQISKYLALGMDLPKVLNCVTKAPAEAIGLYGQIGSLKVGAKADLTICKLEDHDFTFKSYDHAFVKGEKLIKVLATLKHGALRFASFDYY